MDILDLIAYMCNKIMVAFATMMLGTMNMFEESMRTPLHELGLPPPMQTIAIILIPALSVIMIGRMMKGALRFVLVGLLGSLLVHAGWPLVATLFA